jgi:DNA-3-methyladenine glycosylase
VTSGIIVETEGYLEHEDEASHARFGRTQRSAIMFGHPGIAYVYFVYGMHYMFNVVTETDEAAGAVLVRALEPVDGLDLMAARRGRKVNLTNGPDRLCQALAIARDQNGADLSAGPLGIWRRKSYDDIEVEVTPRIGVCGSVDEPYRYLVKGNPHVSK